MHFYVFPFNLGMSVSGFICAVTKLNASVWLNYLYLNYRSQIVYVRQIISLQIAKMQHYFMNRKNIHCCIHI